MRHREHYIRPMSADDVPLVLAVMGPFPVTDDFVEAVQAVRPSIDVVSTPYIESTDVRSAKGKNGGIDPDVLPTPDITDQMRSDWARADMVIGQDLPAAAIELLPNMRWFQSIMAGTEHYDPAVFAGGRARLTTASGIGAVSIAEFIFGRLLQHHKELRVIEEQQRSQTWTLQHGVEIAGRTIGIVGLGAIGRAVATRARAFDMTVLATRGSAKPGDTDPDVDELFPAAEVDAMLARCDVVISSLPATAATKDLFDADRFAAMKPGAWFANVGRGLHVVEPALIAALESGHLCAAALDVCKVEPLPADDPLWTAPNLYLSPHCSVSVDRYLERFELIALENVRRFVAGESLLNDVTLS